jgi:NADPH:quinone reductase-like Zn-dependent oxidoreductase
MKAIVHRAYGPPRDVLALEEIDRPVCGDDDVLVRVRAASVNPADWHIVRGVPYVARLSFGLRAPKHRVPGCDVAGQVEAVGGNVTAFAPGDEVFGSPFEGGFGAFAEHARLSGDRLAPRPATLSFEDAAAMPLAASTALQAVRDHGRVEPGHRVLVIGASGGVGSFAVQIAKSLGAEVTGVCSTRNVDMVRSIGADDVVDYTKADFVERGRRYDFILQAAGTRSSADVRRALTRRGTLVLISGESDGRWLGPVARVAGALALSPFVSQRMTSFTVKPNGEDLQALSRLVEAGTVRPVIDRAYPLSEVPEALRYLEEGHARGKVVLTV